MMHSANVKNIHEKPIKLLKLAYKKPTHFRSTVLNPPWPPSSALAPKTAGSSSVLMDSGTVLKNVVPMLLTGINALV